MKKITLTIDGKEQTLTEGSVVEVTTKKENGCLYTHPILENCKKERKYLGYLKRPVMKNKVIRIDFAKPYQDGYWFLFRVQDIKNIPKHTQHLSLIHI